ncbi:response regulator [Vibrio porteresiae]|uniref:Response regulator n=1 Tax=Vibrio porteresiae DSM 19223 TaxID=1123496 RepID=A0ABZ0Q9J3_9VIBR|nr:response regulator [Vibrio porteresiae]WPC72857.1 response regulator [Vibrio porteresiae DSM 19223]
MERAYQILVVDDHKDIRDLLQRFLQQHGLRVMTAADGNEMYKHLNAQRFDLIILDLMLPGKDGITLCRELRAENNIPIIMLTALGEEVDRIVGLEVGADDYLAKPFNPRELLARIKSVLRRHFAIPNVEEQTSGTPKNYLFNQWLLNTTTRELRNPQQALIPLTSTEFTMLLAFLCHPNVVLSREDLLKLVQGRGADVYDRSIDTLISRLRKKIETDPKQPKLIKTIWGGGYQFSCEVSHDAH